MGLFDKSKQSEQDISQIRQMSSNPQDTSAQAPQQQAIPNQQPQDFVNPFANNASSNVQATSGNLNAAPQQNSQIPQTQDSSLNTNQLPSFDSSIQQNSIGSQIPQQSMSQTTQMPSSMPMGNNSSDEIQSLINETVEKLIEEKWVELTANVQKVVTWKSKVEEQITLIKEDVVAMQEGFSNLERRLISKINNYDKSILDVGSEIKALDKVFQKITPTLVNNVTELGRIAKDLKGVSHEKPSSNSKE